MNRDLRALVAASVRDLVEVVTRLVASVEASANAASSRTRAAADVGGRGEKLSRSIKAHWDTMSPAKRAARIKKMLAARGLKPKPKRTGPPSARSVKLKASLKAHWDALTPAARAARVKKMLAGRGLKPKATPKPA
jgi:hypothetical protein